MDRGRFAAFRERALGDLLHPTSETARVIGAVARATSPNDALASRPSAQASPAHRETVNTMVTQPRRRPDVTRVAREVAPTGSSAVS